MRRRKWVVEPPHACGAAEIPPPTPQPARSPTRPRRLRAAGDLASPLTVAMATELEALALASTAELEAAKHELSTLVAALSGDDPAKKR